MRNLEEIRAEYLMLKEMIEPERSIALVALMNELEQDCGTLIINPTEKDLQAPAIMLYRDIGMSRDL